MAKKPRKTQALWTRQTEGGLIHLEAQGMEGRVLFRLPSVSSQSNLAFAVRPCRHKHYRSLGYTLTPHIPIFHERFPFSLGGSEGLQVISQTTLPRLPWPPPPMPITAIDEIAMQYGSWEAVELLVEQETRQQESASSNGCFHALTSGHGQSLRV